MRVSVCLKDKVPGCENFYWYEVLACPQWGIHVFPSEREYNNLISVTRKVQEIRNRLNRAIRITSGLRPELYNQLIGGAKASVHRWGMALDFAVEGMSAKEVQRRVLMWLEELGIRMEKDDGKERTHVDIRTPGPGGRHFEP